MSVSVALRSAGIGVGAAAVVVGAYVWGHSASAAASPAASTLLAGSTSQAGTAPAAHAAAADLAPASPATSGGGISVTGTGRVTGTPNLLRLDSSVEVTKPDVTTAMQAANTTMADVQKALKADGVAAADLQTSDLSVQPNYNYTSKGASLTGYTVSEDLSVVLRDLHTAGAAISDAAKAGGDAFRLSEATLDIDQDDALIARARQQAFADAKAKAQAYAAAAGRSLGAVVSISESTSGEPQPMYFATNSAPAAAPSVPIQAGSQDVTVTASVVWAFG
jgi:uncharacterized protein